MNCHIHDKHKMHSKKRKADEEVSTSTVVSVDDSLVIYGDGDGDDDDAVSVQSDSYCYSNDILNEAVLVMKIREDIAHKNALSYTRELIHLDMNPILQEEWIVTACDDEDKQVQDVVNSVPVPELPYASFDGFAKVYSPDEEGEHNQRYWERS
jgi:hypothetical protein